MKCKYFRLVFLFKHYFLSIKIPLTVFFYAFELRSKSPFCTRRKINNNNKKNIYTGIIYTNINIYIVTNGKKWRYCLLFEKKKWGNVLQSYN